MKNPKDAPDHTALTFNERNPMNNAKKIQKMSIGKKYIPKKPAKKTPMPTPITPAIIACCRGDKVIYFIRNALYFNLSSNSRAIAYNPYFTLFFGQNQATI
jgi:hypothetical protein